MLQTYYLLDRIGDATMGFYAMTAIFLGAERREEGWSISVMYAMADHSSQKQEYLVREGDVLRFARDFTMYVDKNESGRKTSKKCREMRVSSVTADSLVVEIFPE